MFYFLSIIVLINNIEHTTLKKVAQTFLVKNPQIDTNHSIFHFKTNVPLLPPSGPLSIVHSSIVPKGAKSCRTSSSVCCLLSIPANSFLSAQNKQRKLVKFHCCTTSYINKNKLHFIG